MHSAIRTELKAFAGRMAANNLPAQQGCNNIQDNSEGKSPEGQGQGLGKAQASGQGPGRCVQYGRYCPIINVCLFMPSRVLPGPILWARAKVKRARPAIKPLGQGQGQTQGTGHFGRGRWEPYVVYLSDLWNVCLVLPAWVQGQAPGLVEGMMHRTWRLHDR